MPDQLRYIGSAIDQVFIAEQRMFELRMQTVNDEAIRAGAVLRMQIVTNIHAQLMRSLARAGEQFHAAEIYEQAMED